VSSSPSRYRITRLIQRGGMAEVFEASILGEGGFSRRVALKRLLAEHVGDEGFVRAFVAEAKLVSQLQHANVVGVYDFGTMDDVPFQVLEFVDGLDLVRLEAHAASLGILPPAELWLSVVSEASQGLDYAHHARDGHGRPLGIVHRDVTPSNVLVSWAGGVKLGDFGIARSLEPREGGEPTRVGQVKGKLAYMAPEQLAGDAVDARSDVFAMGCVLHRLLAGASPLETEEARRRVQAGQRPTIDARVPPDVARVLAKALEPERDKRFASAAQLASECARAVAARTATDVRTTIRGWLERMRPPADRPPVSPLGMLMDVELVLSDDADDVLRRFASAVHKTAEVDTRRELEARPEAGLPSARIVRSTVPPQAAPSPVRSSFAPPTRAGRTPASASGSSAAPDPLSGTVVGEYQILELIGKGGFARVYRAKHLVVGREFALKVLLENYKDSPGAQRRFQREALALHAVSHPNLVGIEDSGVTADGRPYIVMELAVGTTLREALIDSGGPFGLHRTRRLARQMASALAEAHRQGLVHRDLKPKNIVLTQGKHGEEAKVLDFGLALLLDPRSELTRLTSAGHYLGTARWMAPEQAVNAAEVGPPADLYCLGLILYAMSVGQPPFRGTPDEVMRKHREEVPDIPAVAGPFAPLIARLLEKDPTRRPATAQQVVEALTRLDLGPEPELAEPSEPTRVETVATEAGAGVLPTRVMVEPGTVALVPKPRGATDDAGRGASQASRASWPEQGSSMRSRESAPARAPLSRGAFVALAALALGAAGVVGAFVALTVTERRAVPVVTAPSSPPAEPPPPPRPLAVGAVGAEAEPPVADGVGGPPGAGGVRGGAASPQGAIGAVAARELPSAAEAGADKSPRGEPSGSDEAAKAGEAAKAEAAARDSARAARAELDAVRASVEARLTAELSERRLTRADLELVEATRVAKGAWAAARDARTAERAGAALLAAVQSFSVDRDALRTRLEEVRAELGRVAVGKGPAVVGPIERRYLDLRSALSSGKDLLVIARDLRALERDVRALE
jgi:serine/threonine protein kinase